MRLAGALAAVVAQSLAQPGTTDAAQPDAPPAFACQLLHDTGRNPFAIAGGDWNRDGRTDLAVSYTTTGSLSVFINQGHRSFRALPEIAVGTVARGIGVADVDGDGDLDMAVASAARHQTALLDNDGAGNLRVTRKLTGGRFPFTAAFADLNADARQDLVVVNESNMPGINAPGTVAVFFDIRKDTPALPLMLNAGQYPSDVQIVDVDGRHGPDLAVTNWGSGTVSVFLNNGDKTFAPAAEVTYGGQVPYSLYTADFNGDAKADLAVTDMAAAVVWILEGDGKGGFAPRRQLRVGQGVRSVAGGDINQDGHPDLVTADTSPGTVSLLLGRPSGDFADAISIPVGPQPRMAMVRDVDGDGRLDLAVTLLGSNSVAVLFQTSGEPVPCPSVPAASERSNQG